MSPGTEPFRGKRIAVCMDGTWQRLRNPNPTNIAKIARAVDHEDFGGAKQIVVYTPGVGAANDLSKDADGTFAGGLFGNGLEDDILQTYIRICLNYQWGDELYIFGYSRGAFSARSLAALIRRCGIFRRRFVQHAPEAFELYRKRKCNPEDAEFLDFRSRTNKRPQGMGPTELPPPIPIAYLGIFDTVGQRGLPSGLGPLSDLVNRRFAFHDTDLSHTVLAARHAVAIDERRFAFPPTLWTNLDSLKRRFLELGYRPDDLPYQQRWFPGLHGDIGGGDAKAPLADFPLAWIIDGATRAGLKIDLSEGTPIGEAARAELLDPTLPFCGRVRGIGGRRLPAGTPFEPQRALAQLHPVAIRRALRSQRYRPTPLRPLRKTFQELRNALNLVDLLLAAAASPTKEARTNAG